MSLAGDWRGTVYSVLDRRLRTQSPAPLLVAFSGGGDSLSLLLLTLSWAEAHGRKVFAFTVDHGLQSASAGWAAEATKVASRLGAHAGILTWTGEKPLSGLPSAARAARHDLLARAARDIGAKVILMGHTADDLLEAERMRAAGSSTPSPREWAPSPAWPEGRDTFLLRPLLRARRHDIRAWLVQQGHHWIDDPANDDPRFARARARQALDAGDIPPPPAALAIPELLGDVRQGAGGDLVLPSDRLSRMPTEDARRLLSAALLCAAGTSRPPRSAALNELLARIGQGTDFTAGLAGARIEVSGGRARFCREPGEYVRSGAASHDPLSAGASLFDGRFELSTDQGGFTVRALCGLADELPKAERAALKALPASVRPTLPVAVFPDGRVSSPILAQDGAVRARPLALSRLQQALGAIEDEAALWRVAK